MTVVGGSPGKSYRPHSISFVSCQQKEIKRYSFHALPGSLRGAMFFYPWVSGLAKNDTIVISSIVDTEGRVYLSIEIDVPHAPT